MAHPANFPRRGSNINTGAGSGPMSTPASSAVSNSHVPAEDYQSPLLMQSQPLVGSSSPGPPHPPHSLNLHSQPQPQALSSGSQVKKKSGFQITSVTPAQISVSTNNSIAEDTESYDDLDESHTEDLSSSEILDVSLSKANDMAGGERSSSEETLNNFHEAVTPGAVSPNQPPHSLIQGPQHGGMVNGNVHHHHHHHHYHHQQGQHNHPHQALAQPPSSAPHSTPTSGGVGAVVPLPRMHGSTAGATISIANPLTSNISIVDMYISSNVPVMGGVSSSASSSGGGFPPSVMSSSGGVGGLMGSGFGNTNPNINLIQNQSSGNVNSSITMNSAAATASSSGMASASVPSSQPAPTLAPATTSSRFRVVKLDSSSEPFKKGRWTCTEYYDKETPGSAPAPSFSESMRPCGPEIVTGGSEREGISGSSVNSTLSHYTDNVGSGEAGGTPLLQSQSHYQDYSNPPKAFQTSHPSLPMGQQMSYALPQQPSSLLQQQPQQTSLQASVAGTGLMPQMGPGVPGFGQQPQGHPLPLDHQHQQQQQSLPGQAQGLATQLPVPPNQGCLASIVPHSNPQNDPQPQNSSGLAQSQLQSQPPRVSMPQAVAAQASALYASLPSFTTTQLEDAQRLLFQHQSALLAQALPKLAGEGGSEIGTGLGTESNPAATAVSALTASAGLFKAVDGDDDG
ncbi:unnamed protein product [Oncorhynchus mykiss]|uniref:TSC22 domain family protein 1 n=1 Tax=Oncorhynchus mykiss TaxID=8022 RepID=A0A060YMQ5_ONCMY|nr:unnamed protein product [Oncorhynchus mykiss]